MLHLVVLECHMIRSAKSGEIITYDVKSLSADVKTVTLFNSIETAVPLVEEVCTKHTTNR